tara:strand:+ start:967 stop:1524 length:558 start_codon:yes stop_codon:yes gene_type:complete
MTNKHFYSWNDIENMCLTITNQMYKERWLPDYIVGITRGGNVPATIISNMLNVPCETLKVSLRDDSKLESNTWMSADAFGSNTGDKVKGSRWDPALRKNILIVDDINDTGATFNWIVNDWQQSCFPNEEGPWNTVWGKNVKFAVLTDNLASKFEMCVNYCCHNINKNEKDVWLVYPWENVGQYNE